MKWTTVTYALLFSGLGLFSYFLIVNYTDFSPQVAELLYSWGTGVHHTCIQPGGIFHALDLGMGEQTICH